MQDIVLAVNRFMLKANIRCTRSMLAVGKIIIHLNAYLIGIAITCIPAIAPRLAIEPRTAKMHKLMRRILPNIFILAHRTSP